MSDCRHCRFAEWDYEEYSNCRDKQWFVEGCIKDLEPVWNEEEECLECEEYEEVRDA